MDEGLLVARLVFGTLLVAHGCQKLFGWFGGQPLNETAAFFESLRFKPGWVFVLMVAGTECGAGGLLALGLLTPVAAATILSLMVVAIATVHWRKGLLSTSNGIELPVLYATAAVSLALTGPGVYSLDDVLGWQAWWTPAYVSIAIAIGLEGGIAALALRRPARPAIPSAWADADA
jgi:putative oxidoreductase